MEELYFQDSQDEGIIGFDSDCYMFVPDSIAADDAGMGFSDNEKAISDKIVEDTFEKDEKDVFMEGVTGQEESSRLKVNDGESNEEHSGSATDVFPRVSEIGVRKSKPPFPFDLNELPIMEISPPSSPRVGGMRNFNLNEIPPADFDEGKAQISNNDVIEVRDFDLNKLPTAGHWKLSDGVDEREFILMLRVARGCRWQHTGAYINLGAFYICGIPVAVVLGFLLQLRGMGLWIGILAGAFTQTVLLAIVASCTNWEKQAIKAKERIFGERVSANNGLI